MKNQIDKHTLIQAVLILALVVMGLLTLIFGQRLLQKPQDIRERASEVTGPVCPANGAMCKWTDLGSDVEYEYIIEKNVNGVWVKLDPNCPCRTSATEARFSSEVGVMYRCTVNVIAKNGASCPSLPSQTISYTCPLREETPTPTATAVPTNTPAVVTPGVPTSTPIPTATVTPKPSEIVVVVNPSGIASPTPTQGATSFPTATKTQAPPPVSGTPLATVGLIAAALFIIVLGFVL